MVVKSYRGLLADGGQEKIRLTTTDGQTGYRIVKFQIIPKQPFNATQESVAKIYKMEQDVPDGAVDFSDRDLLGVAIFKQHDTVNYMAYDSVIFDNEIFNQDIYITNYDAATGEFINYYIELEQIKLTVNQAELLIVKSLRGEVWTRP